MVMSPTLAGCRSCVVNLDRVCGLGAQTAADSPDGKTTGAEHIKA